MSKGVDLLLIGWKKMAAAFGITAFEALFSTVLFFSTPLYFFFFSFVS
jgi:hypothetical protein